MKMIQTIVTALMMVAVAGFAAQAGDISQQVGVFGLYQDTDDAAEGYGGGLKYVVYYDDVVSGLGFGADIRGSLLTEFDDADDVDIYPMELTLLAAYEVIEGTRPYVGGGMGYYFFDEDTADVDDEVGYYCVAGIDQSVGNGMSVFAEAKNLWLEPDSAFGDIELDGVGANIGVAYNW